MGDCFNSLGSGVWFGCGEKYLHTLGIVLTFEEIREMSTFTFKIIVGDKLGLSCAKLRLKLAFLLRLS